MEISGITCKIISDEDYEDLVKTMICIKKIPLINVKKTVFNIMEDLKKKNFYITVKMSLEIAKVINISMKEFKDIHILCPFILDWWNIWHDNFCSGALCYYGNFGDYYKCELSKIPLRLPNKVVDKTWEN